MPPQPIIDLASIDFEAVYADQERVRQSNPQRYEMEQLSCINSIDLEAQTIVGYTDIAEDAFWTRGHIPGRPLMPGVLMIEAAAQICSFYAREASKTDRFIGFGGVDGVKFRGTVIAPCRLVLLGKCLKFRPRRVECYVQGFVDGVMVFEATVVGMPL